MNIAVLKQDSEAVLESVESYDYLIEQRAKAKDKKEIREIDKRAEGIKKHIIEICRGIEKSLKEN